MGAGAVTRALLADGPDALDERDLARRLCRACVDGSDVDGAAVSLLTGSDSRVTLATTDPVAQLLEDLQFSLNEGACMEAAHSGRPVLVPDLHDRVLTTRWPLFADAVLAHSSVSAVFALPLQWGIANLGVLDLYRLAPGPLDDEQWHDVAAAADTATLMMLGHRTATNGRGPGGDGVAGGIDADMDRWLTQVTAYRVEIYQAVGMVQVQLGLAGVDALARMRSHAFVEHRLLIDVARDVVGRRLAFTEEMP